MEQGEIDCISEDMGIVFPALYEKALREIGDGYFFSEPDSDGKQPLEIYHPKSIQNLYEHHFDDPEDLFNRYLPFGCDNHRQDIWIIDITTSKVATIYHEILPNEWEQEDWVDFDTWWSKTIKGQVYYN